MPFPPESSGSFVLNRSSLQLLISDGQRHLLRSLSEALKVNMAARLILQQTPFMNVFQDKALAPCPHFVDRWQELQTPGDGSGNREIETEHTAAVSLRVVQTF